MKLILINILVIAFGCARCAADSIVAAVKDAGYPIEVYNVETADGYKLRLHRIPHGINHLHYEVESSSELGGNETVTRKPNTGRKEVVLLVHGLMTSGIFWVVGDRQKTLAFMLADAGYDVWIFNARCTSFTKHRSLNQNQKAYWNFSWHEIGNIDLPAVIDSILTKTGEKQLRYIGHSQGTTVFFVLLTTKPRYNENISSAFLLAPAVFMHGMTSALKPMLSAANAIYDLSASIGIYAFIPQSVGNKIMFDVFCKQVEQTSEMCLNTVFKVVGDGGQIKDKVSPVFS